MSAIIRLEKHLQSKGRGGGWGDVVGGVWGKCKDMEVYISGYRVLILLSPTPLTKVWMQILGCVLSWI